MPSGGCALARKECVANATALGASVLQAERLFTYEKAGSQYIWNMLHLYGENEPVPLANGGIRMGAQI